MVKDKERLLNNQLNLAEADLRWIEGRAVVKHAALPEQFQDSRLASVMLMRTREWMLNQQEWDQFGVVNAESVRADYRWQPVLEWLAGHPYALLVGDRQLAEKGKRRDKVDIDYSLGNEAPKEWIGPHRYGIEKSMFAQSEIAEAEGINCQVTAHVVAEARGVGVSRLERSGELFENYQVFDPTAEQIQVGDIIFFHERPQISDPKSLHLTTCIGFDMSGVPLLLHATSQAIKTRPAAEIVPISQLLTNRTKYCYGAVRVDSGKGVRSASTKIKPLA